MKKAILFILFLTLQTVLFAQEERVYVPFVEEGKVWYCGYSHPGSCFPQTFEDPKGDGIDCVFTMCGDTQINDKVYKKVYCQFEDYYGDNEQHYYCAVREDAYRVYMIEDGATEEKLLYDFSSPEESLILTYNNQKFARTDGEHLFYFLPGQMEYDFCLFSGDEIDYVNAPGCWVDGVGDPLGNPFAFEFCIHLYDQPKFGVRIMTRTCMKGDKYIFMMDWMAQPVSIDKETHIDNSFKDSPLYDLQGRQLISLPSKGAYIQNGRKVMVK